MDALPSAEEVLDWARNQDPWTAGAIFCTINVLGLSVLPVPIGAFMAVVFGVLYGQVLGMVLYIFTSWLGAWITFGVVRLVRHRIIDMLGPHVETWRRLDAAIMREGLWICFLWRVAPIAPYTVSSAMIAMTDISLWNYLWTTFLGIIPSSFPIVTAAALAGTMLIEQKEVDPLTLAINAISIAAGIYVMFRLTRIAMDVFNRDAALSDRSEVPSAERGGGSGSANDASAAPGQRGAFEGVSKTLGATARGATRMLLGARDAARNMMPFGEGRGTGKPRLLL